MQPDGIAPATDGLSTASGMPGGSTASTARETVPGGTVSAARTGSTSRWQDWAVQHVAVTLSVSEGLNGLIEAQLSR